LSALRHRNFQLYFAAQIVSNKGTWVQITVENWLVLELSHSGLALGVTNALQFGPLVVFGMFGGVVADRRDRRRLLILTQACLGSLALTVGVVAGIGILRVWMIWLAACALGVIKCFDEPAMQSFVKDLVGPGDVTNAVAWANTIKATGRMPSREFRSVAKPIARDMIETHFDERPPIGPPSVRYRAADQKSRRLFWLPRASSRGSYRRSQTLDGISQRTLSLVVLRPCLGAAHQRGNGPYGKPFRIEIGLHLCPGEWH
jgi:hypothetical protein